MISYYKNGGENMIKKMVRICKNVARTCERMTLQYTNDDNDHFGACRCTFLETWVLYDMTVMCEYARAWLYEYDKNMQDGIYESRSL